MKAKPSPQILGSVRPFLRATDQNSALRPPSLIKVRSCIDWCLARRRWGDAMLVLLLILGEVVMRTWSRRKTYRRPVDLMGHTGYATDEGALIPWPVMLHFLEGIQGTRDHLHALNEEIKKWHNQIPDGEERVESMRRMHEDATQPIEQIASVHGAVARAEARARGESVPVRRRR